MQQYNPSQLRADAPHKVKVVLVIRDAEGNKQVVPQVEVFYRGVSLDTVGIIPDVANTEGQERLNIIKKQLAFLVTSIPIFGVGPDCEQKADEAFFGALEDANLDAISKAIEEDRDPNTKPSNS
jgi:hypothetical protein